MASRHVHHLRRLRHHRHHRLYVTYRRAQRLDGRCRIGLPPRVSFPLLCFDVVVNFLLTGVFFWLLRPVLDFHGLLKMSTWFDEKFISKVKHSIRKREAEVETSLEGASLKSAMNKNIKTLL